MATDRKPGKLPRVTFSISDQMDDEQKKIAQAMGDEEPNAELQRMIYQRGLTVVLEDMAKTEDYGKRQVELLEEILSLLKRPQ